MSNWKKIPDLVKTVDTIEAHMEMVVRRMNARNVGVPRDRSQQLDLGDKCYLMGLGNAVGIITGEEKETVVLRVQKRVKPPKKKVVVRRKR